MTAKEYLTRIRQQRFVLREVQKELAEVQADIVSIKASSLSEKVSGTKESDIADRYIKLERYNDEVTEERDKLIDMRREAKAMIDQLPNEVEQGVLYARYINAGSWEQIAVDMHFSWRNLFYIHGKALQSFERLHGIALKNMV